MRGINKKQVTIALLGLVVAAGLSNLSIVQASSIQVSTSNTYLVAGQENKITINLRNIGDRNVVDVQAVLTSATLGISVLEGSQRVYTVIEDGKTKSYSPVIYVDKSMPLGAYTLSLTVTFQKITFEFVTFTMSLGVVVSEPYVPKLGLQIDQNGVTASAGSNGYIEYVFENIADERLMDLEFTLSSESSQIAILGGDIVHIPSVNVGEEFSIIPEVSVLQGTSLGIYSLSATVSYKDDEGNRYNQEFSLPLLIDSESPAKSTIITLKEIRTDEVIYPGDEFKVNLVLECSGADAYDLMSVLGGDLSGSLSPLSPTTIMIGDISAGETVSFSYDLLAKGNIPAGQYPISVTLAYTNNKGAPSSLSETATIQVEGLIDFQLLDVPSLEAPRGRVTELEADLLLIGTQSVEFVSIEAIEDDVVSLVSGSEEYIGAVDPDSPIPFDLTFRIDLRAEKGFHDLGLRINYRDHLNREHSDVIQVPIDIVDPVPETSGNQRQGFFSWLLSILGLRS